MIRDGSVGLVGYNANAKKIKRKSLAGTQFLKSLFWLLKILLFFSFTALLFIWSRYPYHLHFVFVIRKIDGMMEILVISSIGAAQICRRWLASAQLWLHPTPTPTSCPAGLHIPSPSSSAFAHLDSYTVCCYGLICLDHCLRVIS